VISCSKCQYFNTDKVGDGHGIGRCQEYDNYAKKNPGSEALKKALRALGNRDDCDVFWGGKLADRICSKHKPRVI
jgi:hypothetical protein